jgi:RecB family exonuclease
VITPRRSRLVRVPDLRRFQQAIALAATGASPFQAGRTAVIVPSTSAADALRHTLEDLWLVERWAPAAEDCATLEAGDPPRAPGARADDAPIAIALPHLVTRSGLYDLLHARMSDPPERLGRVEREVLLARAAAEAAAAGAVPPFEIRPALVSAMLDLHEAIARRQRTVDDFDRLVGTALEHGAAIDRGARRLLQQTRFLAAAFRAYEDAVARTGAVDEHGLRIRLLADAPADPLVSVVVTVPDQAATPAGLWPADYDLLTRLPGLESLVVVATEAQLEAGYLPRLLETLPDIDVVALAPEERPAPVLLRPAGGELPVYVSRDREEELAAFAGRVRAQSLPSAADGAVALVYQRPLPYLYLARQTFPGFGLSWQAVDALPLAAEPWAAALDLVLSFVTTGWSRASGMALLAAPQFALGPDRRRVQPEEIAACDAGLLEAFHAGGRDRLARIEAGWAAPGAEPLRGRAAGLRERRRRALPAIAALRAAADRLASLEDERPASEQLSTLEAFLRDVEAPPPADDEGRERHLRGRAAVLALLARLRAAFERFGDTPMAATRLAPLVRRTLEEQTFNPRHGPGLVHLVDAQAAPYGHFADVTLVGLVEGEWPDAPGRQIFYPPSLLKDLGWPAEADRRAAARAAFDDLLRLPTRSLALSTFSLEDDGLVRPSPLVEDLDRVALDARALDLPGSAARPLAVVGLAQPGPHPVDWATLRAARPDPDQPAYSGRIGALPPRPYAVTALDRYRECPFKYFAADVLALEEERDDEPGLTPQLRGELVHRVFQRFFQRWVDEGHGAIDVAMLDEARTIFEAVVDEQLGTIPESERAIERARLLGSPVAAGLGERAFRFEAARPVAVVERLLEVAIGGRFAFDGPDGPREVTLRGTADRIDLLADGTLRLLDYKTGKASRARELVQVQMYGVCAERKLAGLHGRSWRVGDAGYLAFGREEPFVPIVTPETRDEALAAGTGKALAAVEAIEAGAFPVQPDDLFTCNFCGFAAVCRKDYVGDE